MQAHQSFRDVFVVNNPTLLGADLFTTDLAVGQLGIFRYDPKQDQKSVSNPSYSLVRAIEIIQGTPELAGNLLGAVANQSKRSKVIKGKKILNFEGRKAERGQTQIVALGYDGVDTTKTISAKCEESKHVFVKLSGGPIDQVFHTEGKGLVRQYNVFSGCCEDCGDDCANVAAEAMADDLVNQIMTDPILSLGTRTGNKLIRVRKVVETPVEPDGNCQEYTLDVCDEGNDTALGRVQAQYPGVTVVRKSRVGSISTYAMILDSEEDAPEAFTNEGVVLVSDCAECPSGYTLSEAGFAYKVERQDAGSAGALTTLNTDYGISASNESSSRIAYEFGQSTYIIVSATEINAAVGTDELKFLGETRNSCVLTDATEIDWVEGAEYDKFEKTFTITLHDNVCGESRLAELQAAYPNLTVSQVSAGECVRKYQTTVESNCLAQDCPTEAPVFKAPDAFEGIEWVATESAGDNTVVGVIFESAFVDRTTGECAFDHWSYDAEPIIIEISQHSQDYNDKPTICADEWPVTTIQETKLPIGVGSRVREEEAFFKGFERKYRDCENPIVREAQDAVLQTDPQQFYDQYTLTFEFDYNQGWFSEKETDTYRLEVYFPEGQGGQFEQAINAYIASVGIDIDPVVLAG